MVVFDEIDRCKSNHQKMISGFMNCLKQYLQQYELHKNIPKLIFGNYELKNVIDMGKI